MTEFMPPPFQKFLAKNPFSFKIHEFHFKNSNSKINNYKIMTMDRKTHLQEERKEYVWMNEKFCRKYKNFKIFTLRNFFNFDFLKKIKFKEDLKKKIIDICRLHSDGRNGRPLVEMRRHCRRNGKSFLQKTFMMESLNVADRNIFRINISI